MDANRFDTWTRNRAVRLSRRNALKVIGATGVAAALPSATSAQSTCSLTVHAQTVGGPTAPTTYDGTLQFSIGADGVFSQVAFTPTGSAPLSATGQAIGRAFDIRIELAPNQLLLLSGATEQPLSVCQGAAAGIFSGPQPGDLGAWQSTSSNSGSPASSSSNPSGSGSSTNCPAPQTTCGPNCCPGGATCTNTSQGLCACPNGTQQCGLSCVPSCTDGQDLDLDSCTCLAACSPDQTACQFDFECCNGACLNGACGSCPGLLCGDMGCVDHMSDPNNCGTCGNLCVDDTGFCLNGVCQCIPDGEQSGSSSSSCCSSGMVGPTGLCGCSHMGEGCISAGQCCDSTSGAVCLGGRNGFDVCCMFPGGACAADTDCCGSAADNVTCIGGICTQPS